MNMSKKALKISFKLVFVVTSPSQLHSSKMTPCDLVVLIMTRIEKKITFAV